MDNRLDSQSIIDCEQISGKKDDEWGFSDLKLVYSQISEEYRDYRLFSQIKTFLKMNGIPFREEGKNLFVTSNNGDKFKELCQKFNSENYYSSMQTADLLGLPRQSVKDAEFFQKIKDIIFYKTMKYFPEAEINRCIKLKNETISSTEVIRILGFGSERVLKTNVSRLQKLGKDIELINPDDHPFGHGFLVRGYSELVATIEHENKIKKAEDRYEQFKLHLKDKAVKNERATKTIEDFYEFVQRRYNKNKNKELPRYHALILESLALNLKKEIANYSIKELENLIITVVKNFHKEAEAEFHQYLSYCKDQKFLDVPSTKFQKTNVTGPIKQDESYTTKQWEDFEALIFGNIDNQEYLDKALSLRTVAMAWLYCALHYVTAYRSGDLRNLPKPDLNVIGFKDGKELLDYLKLGQPFTHIMGDAICKNIYDQFQAYGQTGQKNGVRLRFIVGNSRVRAIGFLLAICEAHRQISRGNANKNHLITRAGADRPYHLRLFGDEYIKIFGEKTFGNLKSTNTHTQKIGEEIKGASGIFISSIMRGHTIQEDCLSSVTANYYMKHGYMNHDKELDVITFNMFEREYLSFAPYLMLYFLNPDFKDIDLLTQTKMIKGLNLKPIQIEDMSKIVLTQKSEISSVLNRIVQSDKNIIKESLSSIVGNKTSAKHQFTQCLLKALIESKSNVETSRITIENNSALCKNCIYPKSINCFGCGFLVAEKFFLIELNDRMREAVNNIKNAKYKRNADKFYELLKIHKNIIKEAILMLGRDKVNLYINKGLMDEITALESNKKLLLE